MIENFKILLNEYDYILANSGRTKFYLRENDFDFDQLEIKLFRERGQIRFELESANDLSDKIKITHPNFNSDRLLEYNNFYISNKLNMGGQWPPKSKK